MHLIQSHCPSNTKACDWHSSKLTVRAYVAVPRRGMRLADTLFLTLAVACLQIHAGMRCASPIPDSCMFRPVHGFDWVLAASVAASLASSALCFVGLEMNDHRQACSPCASQSCEKGDTKHYESVYFTGVGPTTTVGCLSRFSHIPLRCVH